MAHVVKGMTLIPQAMRMSCWYASARMLLHWKMEKEQQSLADLIPPELDAECRRIRDTDAGITNAGLVAMARRIGLQMVPPMTPTPLAVEQWLVRHGPLWVNGRRHITVIAGIRETGRTHEVLVYDPAPVDKGSIGWRGYASWYLNDNWSGRDVSPATQTIFLRCP